MAIEPINFVVFLMGPTASGKTELAIEISKHIDSKLISVDSALILGLQNQEKVLLRRTLMN
jgi:tRNA dimethylallyltransferase